MTPLEERVSALIDTCRGQLPAEQLDDMYQLVRAGEPGVALENLATQLYEYEVALELRTIQEIESLGKIMGLDPKYWSRLAAGEQA